MAGEVVRLEREGDVAVLVLDSPPVNSLSAPVVAGLLRCLGQARDDAEIRACVVIGQGQNFIAGADISELGKASGGGGGEPASDLADALEQLEASPKPVVMAIDGFALGGGLETAMAGHWRIGTPRCRLGLPELKLGIFPGAAGTQRLPRLVGLPLAMEMMLTSRELRATEALEAGLIQEIVEPAGLRAAAVAAARRLADRQLTPVRASQDSSKLPSADEAQKMVAGAKAMLGDKARNQVHHDLCLDAILCGVVEGYPAGLARERDNFKKCLATPQASAMIHMFFAPRTAAKVPGVTDQKFPIKEITRVGVLGGGTMGSGIATSLLEAGLGVVLKEVSADFADAGRGRIEANLRSRLNKGRLTQAQFDEMLSRLTTETRYDGFEMLDLVIEAVIEDIQLKQQVFADLEHYCAPDAILASNTSTIDLEVIGARTHAAERIVGTHFFSPAHVMPLVEVVRSAKTSPQVLNSTIALVKQLKKTPVTVGNCVGFLVNRIFFFYGQAAGLLVDHGVDPYRIDQVLYQWGMPMGPFRMSDLAGNDVSKYAGEILGRAYGERSYASTLLNHNYDEKRFGQKAGKGYYLYSQATKAEPDPDLARLVTQARADAGNPATWNPGDEEIVERVMLPVVNEACRCLAEGIALRPSDIDVASVMGMGFPIYRGGVMKWADQLGARRVCETLSRWAEHDPALYTPADYLVEKAKAGASLL